MPASNLKVRDPLDTASIRAVIPAVHGMQVTLDGDETTHSITRRSNRPSPMATKTIWRPPSSCTAPEATAPSGT